MTEETKPQESVLAPPDAIDDGDVIFPKGIPEKARMVMVLKAYGLSSGTIGRHLGMTDAAVRWYLRKYDPVGRVRRLSEKRKLYLSGIFETLAIEALSNIKPDDIQKLSVRQRVELAVMCAKAIKEVGAKPVEEDPKEDTELLEALKRENTRIIDVG